MAFSRIPLNGCLAFHSGCLGARAFTRSKAKNPWKYIGCSLQSVPSLSNTAIRAGGATNCGPPWVVTASTNFTMACLLGPSFQDGSGSVWPSARLTGPNTIQRKASEAPPPARDLARSRTSLILSSLGRVVQRLLPAGASGCGSRRAAHDWTLVVRLRDIVIGVARHGSVTQVVRDPRAPGEGRAPARIARRATPPAPRAPGRGWRRA